MYSSQFDTQTCSLEFELPDHMIFDHNLNATKDAKRDECKSEGLGAVGRVLSHVDIVLEQCSQLISNDYESDEWLLAVDDGS